MYFREGFLKRAMFSGRMYCSKAPSNLSGEINMRSGLRSVWSILLSYGNIVADGKAGPESSRQRSAVKVENINMERFIDGQLHGSLLGGVRQAKTPTGNGPSPRRGSSPAASEACAEAVFSCSGFEDRQRRSDGRGFHRFTADRHQAG